MSNRSLLVVIAILLVALSCVCVGLINFIVNGDLFAQSEPTLVAEPTFVPTIIREPTQPAPTTTPAPTYTLVIQPGTPLPPLAVVVPTRVNPYSVFVPTPTAQALRYPVTYDARLNIATYLVSGDTTDAIAKSLNANALTDTHDPLGRYYAQTNWNLSSRWTWQPTALGCEVEKAQVTIAVTMTLPSLASPNLAQDSRKRWDTFIANTIKHETGHVNLTFDGARGHQHNISYLLPVMNCSVIETRLNDLFKKDLNAIDQANVDYDTQTKHGATQGAVFP